MAPRSKRLTSRTLISRRGRMTHREIALALSGIKSLAGLSRNQLNILANRISVRPFEKHSLIYGARNSKACVFFQLSGVTRLTCLNRKNKRVLMDVLGPGEVIATPALLAHIRDDLRIEAFTDCQMGTVSPRTLVQEVFGLPFGQFKRALEVSDGRWWRFLARHSAFLEQTLQERVIHALLDLGSAVGVKTHMTVRLPIDITHRDLADLVVGSRSKVTVCLRRLAEEQAIIQEAPSRMIIVPERLRATARII